MSDMNEARSRHAQQDHAEFFHPVHGGPGGRGWEVSRSVFLADVFEAVRPDAAVGYLATLSLVEALTPLYIRAADR